MKLLSFEALPEDPVELRNLVMLRLMFWTGLRSAEVGRLTTTDIVQGFDEGGGVCLVVRRAKSQREDGELWIEDSTAKLLQAYLLRLPALRRSAWTADEDYLFPARFTGRGIGDDTVRSIFDERRKEVGIRRRGRRLIPHCLRHTLATMLLQVPGWTIRDVQMHLRHASIVTTERYLHTSTQQIGGLFRRRHPLRTRPKSHALHQIERGLLAMHEQYSNVGGL